MKAKLFFIILFILTFSAAIHAKEVAMVTEINGTGTIYIGNDQWALELAEVIPDGSSIKVDEGSFLKLLHMVNNKEYSLTGPTEAKIEANKIISSSGGKSVKTATFDIALGSYALEQVGAIDISRTNNQKRKLRPNILPKVKKEKYLENNFDTGSTVTHEINGIIRSSDSVQESKAQPPTPACPAGPRSSSPSVMTKEEGKSDKSLPIAKEIKICFALPLELYKEIKSGKRGYLIKLPQNAIKIQRCPGTEKSEWILFNVIFKNGIANAPADLKISWGNKAMKIMLINETNLNVISALKLEMKNMTYQAAGIWLKLLNKQNKNKTISKHLKLLKAKIESCCKQ